MHSTELIRIVWKSVVNSGGDSILWFSFYFHETLVNKESAPSCIQFPTKEKWHGRTCIPNLGKISLSHLKVIHGKKKILPGIEPGTSRTLTACPHISRHAAHAVMAVIFPHSHSVHRVLWDLSVLALTRRIIRSFSIQKLLYRGNLKNPRQLPTSYFENIVDSRLFSCKRVSTNSCKWYYAN